MRLKTKQNMYLISCIGLFSNLFLFHHLWESKGLDSELLPVNWRRTWSNNWRKWRHNEAGFVSVTVCTTHCLHTPFTLHHGLSGWRKGRRPENRPSSAPCIIKPLHCLTSLWFETSVCPFASKHTRTHHPQASKNTHSYCTGANMHVHKRRLPKSLNDKQQIKEYHFCPSSRWWRVVFTPRCMERETKVSFWSADQREWKAQYGKRTSSI